MKFYFLFIFILLIGCANSANHEVVDVSYPSDDKMSCTQINDEISRINKIVRDVEQDKKDMTGADVVDGVLWFPFNVIAKHSNYKNAKEAADARMRHLQVLSSDKGCSDASKIEQDIQAEEKKHIYGKQVTNEALKQRIRDLNQLYRDGLITKKEFKAKKKELLKEL